MSQLSRMCSPFNYNSADCKASQIFRALVESSEKPLKNVGVGCSVTRAGDLFAQVRTANSLSSALKLSPMIGESWSGRPRLSGLDYSQLIIRNVHL
jgi:hypothetical protein